MSMSRADILYECLGEFTDNFTDEETLEFYRLLSELYDIAEGNL